MNKQPSPEKRGPSRIVVIGGFLGAGKTTAIVRFGEFLRARNVRVGVITNDHGNELVDSATFGSKGFSTEEIRNGSFSTHFDLLVEGVRRLVNAGAGDVVVVEPVGSATDLVATLTHPLRQLHRSEYVIAPVSVLVDPVRAARILRLESGGTFSEKIVYLYRKQLEEADIIVINKSDLLTPAKLTKLWSALQEIAPEAKLFNVSARTGAGLEEWFECLMTKEQEERNAADLDYAIYAEGEALLGWLNCTVSLSSVKYFDAGKLLVDLATAIQAILKQEGVEGAHLKLVLMPEHDRKDVAVLSLVRTDDPPYLAREVSEPIQRGEMILNIRAEANPALLHESVNRALMVLMEQSPELFARMQHSEHFRPGKSKPTHRITTVENKEMVVRREG